MRHEERVTAQSDRRADVALAAIRDREANLAERLAAARPASAARAPSRVGARYSR